MSLRISYMLIIWALYKMISVHDADKHREVHQGMVSK